jgi:hypothetical protein
MNRAESSHRRGANGTSTGGQAADVRGGFTCDLENPYEGLGDRDKALEWFEKTFADRSMHVWVIRDPRLDQIRGDSRFALIMRRMGLPQ